MSPLSLICIFSGATPSNLTLALPRSDIGPLLKTTAEHKNHRSPQWNSIENLLPSPPVSCSSFSAIYCLGATVLVAFQLEDKATQKELPRKPDVALSLPLHL